MKHWPGVEAIELGTTVEESLVSVEEIRDAMATPGGKKVVAGIRRQIKAEAAGLRELRGKILAGLGISKRQMKRLAAIERTGDQAQIDAWYAEQMAKIEIEAEDA